LGEAPPGGRHRSDDRGGWLQTARTAVDTKGEESVSGCERTTMSEEAAQAFVERMKSDEAFRVRVLAMEDPGERLKLVRAEGYDCSDAEIAAQGNRLQDEHLEMIVGGDCGSQEGVYDPWGILRYTQGYS
jgi:predicted ribosomally synthesized peptide with nif11-like leader